MPKQPQQIYAPGLLQQECSEALMFGSAVWLWMQSDLHRELSLQALSTLLLPAIKTRQFLLVTESDKPVFYLSWALMDCSAEESFLRNPSTHFPEEAWVSGDRMWILDWVAPFGHTNSMRSLVKRLFPTKCFRWLYHRGGNKGMRILESQGNSVLPLEARFWFESNPVAYQPSI